MNPYLENPAFVAYAITCLVLALQLIFLWAYSGFVRARTKTAINPEDGARPGTTVIGVDPPEVARVLRVHANAQATTYPFLFLGLVYVLAGGSAEFARAVFAFFVVTRILHAVAYLLGKQPWRTIFFALSGVALAVLWGAVVRMLF